MPRRRRGATAAAIDAYTKRGFLLRILLYSPKDVVAGLLAFAAVSAIIANALFLQAGPHPAPMFASVRLLGSPTPVNVLPRPRPAEADVAPPETRLAEPKPAEPRNSDAKSPDPQSSLVRTTAGPRSAAVACRDDPIHRLAPCGGGAARVDRIWLWPVEAERNHRGGYAGRDPEIRAGAQAAGDRTGVRPSGARARGRDRPSDRLIRRHPNARCEKPDLRARSGKMGSGFPSRHRSKALCGDLAPTRRRDHDPVSPDRIMISGGGRASAVFRRA